MCAVKDTLKFDIQFFRGDDFRHDDRFMLGDILETNVGVLDGLLQALDCICGLFACDIVALLKGIEVLEQPRRRVIERYRRSDPRQHAQGQPP